MQSYELMLVLSVNSAANDEKKQEELVKKLLQNQEVSDLEVTQWAKRHLAYEINKQTEAIFVLATFKSKAVQMTLIESQVKLQSDILRYLLTKKEETK